MNATPNSELLVDLQREIAAPVHSVFEAWLDAAMLASFLKPAPGVMVEELAVDAREGGAFSLTMCVGEARIPIRGTYAEITRYTKLVFSWLSNATTAASEVTLVFSEPTPGLTRLHLRHVGFPNRGSRDDHDGGWAHILKSLAFALVPA